VIGPMPSGPSVPAGPTMPVPEFTIHITLTPQAAEKLSNAGETISGTIWFDGDGTSLPNEHNAPFRAIFLGGYEFELRGSGEVRVSDAIIPQEAYGRLSDMNYYFTVNVTSGRRAFKDNILDGGVAFGRLTDLDSKKPIEIKCGLL
jgi:hypothetical protein